MILGSGNRCVYDRDVTDIRINIRKIKFWDNRFRFADAKLIFEYSHPQNQIAFVFPFAKADSGLFDFAFAIIIFRYFYSHSLHH